jgi:hypothetical protein
MYMKTLLVSGKIELQSGNRPPDGNDSSNSPAKRRGRDLVSLPIRLGRHYLYRMRSGGVRLCHKTKLLWSFNS